MDDKGNVVEVVRRCLISSGDGNLYVEPGDSGSPVFLVYYNTGVFVLGHVIIVNLERRATFIKSVDKYTIYDATYGC